MLRETLTRLATTVCAALVLTAFAYGESLSEKLADELPVLGHRNWVVIADSAYPSQTAPGIKTMYVGGDQINAVEQVLKLVDNAEHVRANIFVDKELKFVPESHAKGIGKFRDRLAKKLHQREVKSLPHAEIIQKLDEAGQTFHVVIIKTDLTLPYTSVFIQLDAGYWSAESEAVLRKAMKEAN